MSQNPAITAEQADRAIYIDFEGTTDDAPSVLGIHMEDAIEHVILEEQLLPLVHLTNPRYRVTTSSLDETIARILHRAQQEDRLVVGFTLHDRMVVRAHATDDELIDWFSGTYVNAKKPIDRWIRQQVNEDRIDPPIDKSLRSSMRTIGMDYKPGCGINVVGKTLRRLRWQLATKQHVTDVAEGARRHWWKVLSHNTTDLQATRALLQCAAKEDA